MARNKKKIRLTSDYTIIKKSPNTLNGTKYIETEYPTTTRLPYNPNGQIVINANTGSNFMLSKAIDNVSRRKSPIPDWIDTYEMPAPSVASDDGVKSIAVPNLHSLKNFAYYGSAVKLIEDSVTYVINHFPAELYFTNSETEINGHKYCYIENPFQIDCDSKQIDIDNVSNELRYLTVSINDYVIITSGNVYTFCGENSISVTSQKPSCNVLVEGDFVSSTIVLKPDNASGTTLTFYGIYRDGVKSYYYDSANKAEYSGIKLRPTKDKLDEFYANANYFVKALLNSSTNPLYMATIETPKMTDKGIYYNDKTYIWPSSHDYNPEINGLVYTKYIKSLLTLGDVYDEYFSNNAWKILTHESIKGLDWTNKSNGEDDNIDSTKIEALIKLYARQYDDIKYYIDSMKISNNVNYTTNNSVSDEMLTEKLHNTPFDSATLKFFSDKDVITPILYASENCGYEECDAINRFIKTIILNSKYLGSLRGTRLGLETMLSLLGFDKTQYDIDEYIAIALGDDSTNGIKYPLLDTVVEYNLNKNNLINLDDDNVDVLDGLPLNIVDFTSGNNVTSYVIPWYTDGRTYDGDLYFQMNGGWGKNGRKYITKAMVKTDIDSLVLDSAVTLYSETKMHVEVVEDLEELKSTRNYQTNRMPIYYVKDIDGMLDDGSYTVKDTTEYNNIKSYGTHYFVLEDRDYYFMAGHIGDGVYGWRNILKTEYDGSTTPTNVGRELLYQLSLNYVNNDVEAHWGNGKYDDGEEYIARMEKPMNWAVENNMFSVYDETELQTISNIGYTISGMTNDNQKCWYFVNSGEVKTNLLQTEDGETYTSSTVIPSIGINPYNPETGNRDNDEASANSIINLKNIKITLYIDDDKFDEGEKFVYTVASKYIYYMTPASSILTLNVAKNTK